VELSEEEAVTLVARIVAFNDAWHALRELRADGAVDDPSLASLRDIKGALQARLLRDGGGLAYLERDEHPSLPERCFTVALRRRVGGRSDACHLPERVARQVLTPSEISFALDEL
jgi:hypothetical protein